MKYFIISDIHGNMEALEAVLERVKDEKVVCLGDVIGYGPDPVACIEKMRTLDIPCIMGNHDHVQLNQDRIPYFNPLARISTALTAQALQPEHLDWLRTMPEEILLGDLYFTHSSPYETSKFYYLLPGDTASPYLLLSFVRLASLGITTAFTGHTHIPGLFSVADGRIQYQALEPGTACKLSGDHRYIISCPSTGQPRNGIPEAQYAVHDVSAGTLELHSVPYDIQKTVHKMQEAKIPEELWKRLLKGR